MEKTKVLVLIETNEETRKFLRQEAESAELCFCEKADLTEDIVNQAEVILGNLPKRWIPSAKKLKWLHLESAGSENYVSPEVLPESVTLTNSTGAYGPAIAEHMLAGVLMLIKKLNQYQKNQELRVWKSEGRVQSLKGSSVLVVGLGDIGREFAWRMKALGCQVTGVKRTPGKKPEFVDRLVLMEDIAQELPRADIVALCLPSTPETRHFFNYERLSLTQKGSILINVGRGVTVGTEALVRLLDEGHFQGLVLDVVDPEPLPMNHRLWGFPNVILTPHISGNYNQQSTYDRVIAMAVENLKRYLAGQPLRYQVDRTTGYRKSNSAE